MSRFRFLLSGAVLAIAAGVMAAPYGAAQATVPTLVIGDAFGFGTHIDLGEFAAPYLAMARELDASDPNTTIEELNLTGSFDHWTYIEVVDTTNLYYEMRSESATGVLLRFIARVTSAQLPAPGTYATCSFEDIRQETRTVSVTADLAYLESISAASKWNVSDLALREATANHSVDLRATLAARNVPSIDANATSCQISVTYGDRNLTLDVDLTNQYRAVFSPALDLFDFPIQDNETWWANSTATVAGSLSGTIDVLGLEPEEEADFFAALNDAFQASGVVVTGLDGFPIVLRNIEITIGAVKYLEDGVLHDFSFPVSLQLHADARDRFLADGNPHTVYLIGPPPSEFALVTSGWIYSPEDGFVVGYEVDVTSGGATAAIFELENVPPATARQEVQDTRSSYVVRPTEDPIVAFFLKPPFLGLLLVAAAILVAGAILMRRRRRGSMAAPGPPPTQAMPPEPGPPPPPPPQGP